MMSWNPKWKQLFMNCHPDCFSQSATVLMDSTSSLQFLGKACSVLPNIQTVQMWHSSTGQTIHTWHPKVSDLWNVPVAYQPDSSSSAGFPWGTDHVTLFSWKNKKWWRGKIWHVMCFYCWFISQSRGFSSFGMMFASTVSTLWEFLWKMSHVDDLPIAIFNYRDVWSLAAVEIIPKASVPRLFRFWASCTHLYRGLDRSQNRQNPNFDSNFLLAMPIDYWDVLICPPNGNVNWNKMIHHEILSYCTLCSIAFRQTHSLGSQCPSEAAATRILMPLIGNKCQV